MNFELRPITPEDRKPVIDLFNYYIENSFAAYPEKTVPYEFFDILLMMCKGYPAIVATDENHNIIGFGILRSYSPLPVFSQTAEITYFIKQEFTGNGIGKAMLDYLVEGANKMGLTSILANISSLNERSINFHRKNGFVECGRLEKVGKKKNTLFDVVYMQKKL